MWSEVDLEMIGRAGEREAKKTHKRARLWMEGIQEKIGGRTKDGGCLRGKVKTTKLKENNRVVGSGRER